MNQISLNTNMRAFLLIIYYCYKISVELHEKSESQWLIFKLEEYAWKDLRRVKVINISVERETLLKPGQSTEDCKQFVK